MTYRRSAPSKLDDCGFIFNFCLFFFFQILSQDKELHSSRGIIITNQTLVLQGISKSTHGQYICQATNTQGTVNSNEVFLNVKCRFIYLGFSPNACQYAQNGNERINFE